MRVKRSRTAFLRPMGTGRESERQFSNVTGIGRKQGPASGRVLSSLSSTSQNFRHILLCYVGFSDKKCSNLSPTYFVINSRHRPWLRINLSLFWIQFCQYCENFSCIFLVIERPNANDYAIDWLRFEMQRFNMLSECINNNNGSVERTQLNCQTDRSLLATNEGVEESCAAEEFVFI